MREQTRLNAERLGEWLRKRIQLNLAFLEWLQETARLDADTVRELDRLYAGLTRYAALGRPLRDCSPTDLSVIAGHPALLIEEPDLTPLVKSTEALSRSPAQTVEQLLLKAWLGRPIK